jgi:hypothetical protein
MKNRVTWGLLVVLLLLSGAIAVPAAESAASYTDEIKAFRAQREQRLRADDGWLSLVALDWLDQGDNAVGSDASATVHLPVGSAPARVGTIRLEGATAVFSAADGVDVTVNGSAPAGPTTLRDESNGKPDLVEVGSLSFYVIQRGDRWAVRVKDANSPTLAAFHGLDYYPVDPAWKVEATFKPYHEPIETKVPTVVETQATLYSRGVLEFTAAGRPLTLTAMSYQPDDDTFFMMFRDATSGEQTYGAGRYLSAPLHDDGTVTLDFNRAYNPPCAFTPFATCPLPPPENRLEIPVTAGEKKSGNH